MAHARFHSPRPYGKISVFLSSCASMKSGFATSSPPNVRTKGRWFVAIGIVSVYCAAYGGVFVGLLIRWPN